MWRAARAVPAGTLLSLLAACGGDAPPAPASLPAPELPTVVVQPVTAAAERRLDGTVEAVNQATIAAQTSGRVAEILYDVNDFVPAGAVVLRIRSTEQRSGLSQAQAALKEAEAREAEAQSRYDRIAAMYERQVVSRAQRDQALAERDAAVARRTAARAAVDAATEGVAYTEVRAPYAGVVTARKIRVGEAVAPGTELMSGLSLEKLRVSVDIPQSLVAQVRVLKKAVVYVDGRRIEAVKVTVFPEADAASKTFRTRVELPANVADLYPGMYVKVGFVTGEATRLLVPRTAIVTRSEVTGVYVVAPDNRVSLRQVRVGQAFPGPDGTEQVEVLAGLAAGERVALDPVAASRIG
jgi:RND family efflux transporter MFP subunit